MTYSRTIDDEVDHLKSKMPNTWNQNDDGRRSRSPVNTDTSSVRDQMYDLDIRKKLRDIRSRFRTEIDVQHEEIAKCQKYIQQTEEFYNSFEGRELPEDDSRARARAHLDAQTTKHHLNYLEDGLRRIKERERQEIYDVKEEAEDEKERQRLLTEFGNEQQLGESDEEAVHRWSLKNQPDNLPRKTENKTESCPPFHQAPYSFSNEHASWPGSFAPNPTPRNFNKEIKQQPTTCSANETVSQLASALQALGSRSNNVDRKLPIFSGDPSEWCNFHAAYKRTEAKFDMAENMMRLQDAVSGKAKTTVSHLMANPLNLKGVLEALERRFGRPEHVLDCLVEKAKSCSKPELRNPESLIEFGTAVKALVTNICSYNQSDYMNNKQLVKELIAKLPPQWQENWYEHLISDPTRKTTMSDFHAWLMPKIYAAEMRLKPDKPYWDGKETKQEAKQKSGAVNLAVPSTLATGARKKERYCFLCTTNGHGLETCKLFERKDISEKWNIAKSLGVCFCCLRKGHRTVDCRTKKTCDVDGCKRFHHPFLHSGINMQSRQTGDERQGRQPYADEYETQPPTAPVGNDVGLFGSVASADILPVIPVIVKGPKSTEKVYALLDTGASFSMLETEIAQRLGLQGRKEPLNFTVFGGNRVENDSKCVSLRVAGVYKKAPFYQMKSVYTINKLGLPNRTFDASELKRRFPHLNKMQAKSMKDATPQMVIGINAGGLFAAREILESEPGETPAAIRSLLGWYVAYDPETVGKQFQMLYINNDDDDKLHNLIKDFFSTESFGVSVKFENTRSKEDRIALKQLEENTVKKNGRWVSSLLWKDQLTVLPESENMALRRLQLMERKMDKYSDFAKLCIGKFDDYIAKQYLIPRDEKSEKEWYLPWFFAFHPSKKPRLVFDAAAKSRGKCLNDFLLKGPDLLQPLPAILLRFRMHLIGLTGDIQEMFHQVGLKKEDQSCQTILYRGMDRISAPKKYIMPRLFFGSASSPCSAIYAKDKNAEEHADEYPSAVKAIRKDFYMDDFLGGADEEDEAIKLQKEIACIHSNGGFRVVKWNSSSSNVLNSIPIEIRANNEVHFMDKTDVPVEKTLGLFWCPRKDAFSFNLSFSRIPTPILQLLRPPTKREMVSLVMSVFDPLGFLSPLRVKALILIQHVWRCGVGWDESIPDNIMLYWRSWIQALKNINKITVPRCITTVKLREADSTQLHIFCDASEEAFAAVAYLRIGTGGSFFTSFLMGKARVAPLKGLSIPRMELQAAVMGVRLGKTIKASYSNDIKFDRTVYWTDSKTVLCWIRSISGRFNMFVSNRLGEILESSNVEDWKWVPTQENVADEATRLKQKIDLTSECRWLNCVAFLRKDEKDWPTEDKEATVKAVKAEEMEVKKTLAIVLRTELLYIPDVNNYSCWIRLIRGTAARFLAVRKFTKKEPNYITVEDMRKAKLEWIRKSQQESFPIEYQALLLGQPLDKKSRLYNFSPSLNENGIVVMMGRLDRANVEENVKHPPLLDPKHRYTQLMIDWFHRIGNHFGQERVIHALRQHVWILDSRAAVKRCWSKCLLCQAKQAKPKPPEMGQLPTGRVDIGNPAFSHTGVDYFGPYHVRILRSTVKRWGVLFSCLTTRAVHLELAESLDASDFINALVRFMNTRGQPIHIWSDNGTNFVRTDKELRKGLFEMKQSTVADFLAVRNVEWHFIPPASPHMGGSWERMVGATKKVLSAILKEQNPKESTLRTLFCEVMGILNSRPLTYASTNPEDYDPITPSTLLNMASVVGSSFPGVYGEEDKFKKSWRYSQYLAEQFWKRWSIEYLPWLAKREKWHQRQKNIEVGDLVIVLEDYSPRNQWRKGLVTAVHPGEDHQVRAVTVKLASVDPKDPKKIVKISELRRPVSKICLLALTDDKAPGGAGREKCQDEA